MKRLTLPLLACVLAFAARTALGNSAPPAFWGAGHGTTITPLFSDEAKAISMIQMQKELVLIDLYADYAVVKGTYWLMNHDAVPHSIHVGYPINGSNRSHPMEFVHFKDLHYLRVRVDGQEHRHYRLREHPDSNLMRKDVDGMGVMNRAENWYVWTMDFPAGRPVKLEVYFIVLTPASMTKGYGRKEANAFEYVLQTGSAWKDSILSGDIVVNLKSGLTTEEILGIFPDSTVRQSGTQLLYSFRSLRPGAQDDLIIWYQGARDNLVSNLDPELLYRSIDRTDTAILAGSGLPLLSRSELSTPASGVDFLFYGYLMAVFGFVALLGYGLYRLVAYLVRRSRRGAS